MTEKIKQCIVRLGAARLKYIASMVIVFVAVLLVLAFSVNKITVNDGANTQTIYSLKSAPAELLKLATLSSNNYKITDVAEKGNKINISLRYTFPVFVTVGETTHEVNVLSGSTVAAAVADAGIALDEHDIVNLPLEQTLSSTQYIDVIDINYVSSTETQRIPYTSKTVYSSKTTGKTVTTKGSEGVKEVVTLTKYVNGKAESVETVSVNIIRGAIQEVITVGTKKPVADVVTADNKIVGTISQLKPNKPIELDADGNPIDYKKHITVQATAYSPSDGDIGASGIKLQPGHVAVNTNIFPFGTRFYIKSSDGSYIYGYAVAADTGGFVSTHPTNFDLYFSSREEARQFGRRNIEVYVLN